MNVNLNVANDNGNSEQDLVINDILIQEPNVFAKTATLPNLDEVNPEYVLKNIHSNLIVAIEGVRYFIGNYALKSGKRCRSIEVGVDNNKVDSEIVYVNTLAHIAAAAVYEASKEGLPTDIIKATVDMATALPVSYYSKKNAKAFTEKFMNKSHHIIVYVGTKEIMTEINFQYIKVIPEGVTAAFAFQKYDNIFNDYNKNNDGKLDNNFFETAKVLHVAIGEGTTEFPITTAGQFNPNFIKGTNNGNGHAIDSIINEFKKNYGLIKFTRQDFSNVIKNPDHKYYNTALDLIEPALEDEAEEILHTAEQVIQEANNDVNIVCVYGGGSILMREALEKRLNKFCDRAEIKVLYVPEEYAVTLEATGLDAFIKSDIFKKLKNSFMEKKSA